MELHVSATFQKYGNMRFRPVIRAVIQLWQLKKYFKVLRKLVNRGSLRVVLS